VDAPSLRAYLQLVRPANLVTASADVLAGAAVTGFANPSALPPLVCAGMALYGGGVVFNDIFDRRLDAIERPERPLPSGRARVGPAVVLGSLLFLTGIILALFASAISGLVALAIVGLALIYDRWAKHVKVVGPVNMGMCRALNLMLGMTAAPAAISDRWYWALLPLIYIAAITAISAGEVHGGSRPSLMAALVAVCVVIAALPFLAELTAEVLWTLPFAGILVWRVIPRLWVAYQTPEPKRIRFAVKTGVLSLIVLNSAIAAAAGNPIVGLGILALAPAAGWLARLFAVT
jgi:4-hydroxybenzoate polyprenyltransferase